MPSSREAALAELLCTLGLSSPPPLFDRALTHPSYVNEHREEGIEDNQRLEFLGDAVLDLCVSEILLEELPAADEGMLTRAYAALVNTETLADWARRRGVGPALRVGKGAAMGGVHERTNVLADTVEAMLAAVYLDGGLEAARRMVRQVVDDVIGQRGTLVLPEALARRDPKTELQEWLQSQGRAAPVYRVLAVEGPPHDLRFVVGVEIDGAVVSEGRGRSKKLAEQAAATGALERARSPVSAIGRAQAPPSDDPSAQERS